MSVQPSLCRPWSETPKIGSRDTAQFLTECGGKMHLREGEYERAHTDFFEAFKNYDESGSPRWVVIPLYFHYTNMLMQYTMVIMVV